MIDGRVVVLQHLQYAYMPVCGEHVKFVTKMYKMSFYTQLSPLQYSLQPFDRHQGDALHIIGIHVHCGVRAKFGTKSGGVTSPIIPFSYRSASRKLLLLMNFLLDIRSNYRIKQFLLYLIKGTWQECSDERKWS